MYDQSNVCRHGNYCFYFSIFNFWLLFLCTKGCLFDGGYFSQNPKQQFSGANSTLSGAYSALWSRHTPLHRSYGIKRWIGNGNNYFIHVYYIPLRSHDSHDSSKLPYTWIVYVQVIVEKSFLYSLKKGQKPEKWSWPAPLVHVYVCTSFCHFIN